MTLVVCALDLTGLRLSVLPTSRAYDVAKHTAECLTSFSQWLYDLGIVSVFVRFTGKKTEVSYGYSVCPRSYSWQKTEPGFKQRSGGPLGHSLTIAFDCLINMRNVKKLYKGLQIWGSKYLGVQNSKIWFISQGQTCVLSSHVQWSMQALPGLLCIPHLIPNSLQTADSFSSTPKMKNNNSKSQKPLSKALSMHANLCAWITVLS